MKLPSRQVHLDFHTSEFIPGIGKDFDKNQFQEALRIGNVNSITIFAKCHHSWCYYPTKVGMPHPNLERHDLLGEMIEACHEIGVSAPIYITVGWSSNDAENHPEWCATNPDGSYIVTGGAKAEGQSEKNPDPNARRPIASWKWLYPLDDYLEHILALTDEICSSYSVDGIFYDITNGPVSYSASAIKRMRTRGYDPKKEADILKFNEWVWKNFMSSCRSVIENRHPAARVFFNGTTVMHSKSPLARNTQVGMHESNTHHELEDLPTTWGGYDKFPLRSKFFHNTGRKLLAQSGKFHTMWGEFGGFKHPDSIRFEAASMIAFGAACSMGDQLHPNGAMDMSTYRSIGYAFEYVEQIEEYGLGGKPVSNLGLYLTQSESDDEGTSRMLLETHNDYVVVDPETDWTELDTIVLSGAASLDETQARKLTEFVKQGGGLLVQGESALDSRKKEFFIEIGADYLGEANYDEDYLVIGDQLRGNIVASPIINYEAALRVSAHEDSEILAALQEPYFNRTYERYCSHQNTPNQLEDAPHPGAIRKDRVIFLPHRMGKLYFEHGARVHRDIFTNALELLYKDPILRIDLPSAGRISFLKQAEFSRYVLHVLYGPPMMRGRCEIVEDFPALRDIAVEIRVPETIAKAQLVPQNIEIDFRQTDSGSIEFFIPEMAAHQAIAFAYQ